MVLKVDWSSVVSENVAPEHPGIGQTTFQQCGGIAISSYFSSTGCVMQTYVRTSIKDAGCSASECLKLEGHGVCQDVGGIHVWPYTLTASEDETGCAQ